MAPRGRWLVGMALLATASCGGEGTGPGGDTDGQRLAGQFERLADSVDGAGHSATAEALRHAAEIVRLTGRATPVKLTIDGAARSFLAVAEQLDIPRLECSWPSDSGVAPPPPPAPPRDTVTVPPSDSGSIPLTTTSMDSVPASGCVEVGTFSMRTLIAWEPERMAEVVRVVADIGSNGVEPGVPDVMTGIPTTTGDDVPPASPGSPPVPGDSGGSGGGSGGGRGGYPGFIGEYLVGEAGAWYAVEGSQANALESSGGDCTAARASFDWAEFACEAARLRFGFRMRLETLWWPGEPTPLTGTPGSPDDPAGSHTIAMTETSVDGVRLSVIAWAPPPVPVPGPLPPDSVVTRN
jgi:hypothetical protein